jgi:hypothetical protein
MDLGKAFTFITEDEQWLMTLLIGGALLFIPIFGWFVLLGFSMEIARNVLRGSARPLPRWENFGEKFMLGLYSFVIQLVYVLPAILLLFLFLCVFGLLAAAGQGNEEAITGILVLTAICFLPLFLVASVITQPFMWAAHARYLQTGSLGAAFRFSEIFATTRANLGVWVVVWLLYLLCGMVAQAGVVIFFVGLLISIPYAYMVFGHILGQAAAPRAPQPYQYAPPPPSYQ